MLIRQTSTTPVGLPFSNNVILEAELGWEGFQVVLASKLLQQKYCAVKHPPTE